MRRCLALSVALLMIAVSGCSSSDSSAPTTTGATTEPAAEQQREPLAEQVPPPSINGLTVDGDVLWVASIEGDQVLAVDRQTGLIVEQHDTGGAQPDDVAVAPDGSVFSTGFGNGDIGRISDSSYEVAATTRAGINAIDVDDDGTVYAAVWGNGGVLYRIPDGGEPEVVAEDLPDVNAFAVMDDGTILAPAGGFTGPGQVVRIDPATGEVTTVVTDLPPLLAGTVDPDGTFVALANLTGERFAVDAENGTAEPLDTVEGGPFDNLAYADDGTVYLARFEGPTIIEVAPDGTRRTITIGG